VINTRAEESPEGLLKQHVEKLSVDFATRSHKDLKNLNATAEYILNAFKSSGAEVEEQSFEANGQIYRNIIGQYGTKTGPLRIVGAHYDAAEGTPGADDNASGVAGLLELARRLGETENPPPIQHVAYTLEEPPFFGTQSMGSYIHAKSLNEQKQEVEWMISLEMIGYFSDQRGSQTYPIAGMENLYPDKGNFIAVISRLDQVELTQKIHALMQSATDLPVEFLNAPERLPSVAFSDHRNYWAFGFPAVMVTDTAFMRNREYHATGDTADRLDYKRMAKVVEGVFKALLHKP
jgi:Zn-dependent M28 family amino/carboxypeptidase